MNLFNSEIYPNIQLAHAYPIIFIGYSLEGLMLKLTFQYFGHLMCRTDSLEKNLFLGKIEGKRSGDRG